MSRHQPLCTFVALVCCLVVVGAAGPNRLVRVNLRKSTNDEGGSLGQPLTSYYTKIEVGTPGKPYKMLVDVNAREIWLPHFSIIGLIGARLNYGIGYAKKGSSTSVKEEKEIYSIGYKDTELAGKAYRDVFAFTDVTESLSPVKFEQRFLAISSSNNNHFNRFKADGVLPLNPWPISETGSDLPTIGLRRAKLTNELKFALQLDRNETSNEGGELTFGGLNPTKFMGALRYHQVQGQHAWEVNLSNVMLGAETMGCTKDKCTAQLSTNTNDIYGPARYVRQILVSLGAENVTNVYDEGKLYAIDCLKVATAPTLTFVIDDAYYMLHPLSYIKKRTEGAIFKSMSCYVSILSNGSDHKWELGTNFLSNYYTVFDLDQRSVAFGMLTNRA